MKNDLVILFGSGRSGTSWLHLLLGAHPRIVTGQQSRIFERYLQPLYQRFQTELKDAERGEGRIHGLSSFIGEDQLVDWIRRFADDVFTSVEREKPDATITLENQPGDSASLPLIARCFPNVKFIHSIRDGRDVALSLYLGYERFGLRDLSTAAKWWRDRARLGLSGRELGRPYFEVKYEDLQDNGPIVLQGIFEFLGVDCTTAEAEALIDEYSFDRVRAGAHTSPFVNPGDVAASGTDGKREPKGFFRSGTSNQWRSLLSRRDIRVIENVAGDLLKELGYPPSERSEIPWARRSIEPVAGRLISQLLRVSRSTDKWLARVLTPLGLPKRRR